jgi:hypothetical protein
MKSFLRQTVSFFRLGRRYLSLIFGLLLAAPAFAQANSPWENAVNVLQQAFTSTIARGLSLVAISFIPARSAAETTLLKPTKWKRPGLASTP